MNYCVVDTGSGGGHHADGGLVHHAHDGDGHADPLRVQVEEHEEADDGKTEPRGAEQRSRLDSSILLHVHTGYNQVTTTSRALS